MARPQTTKIAFGKADKIFPSADSSIIMTDLIRLLNDTSPSGGIYTDTVTVEDSR